LTNGGIYGTIVGFRDSVVQLQVAKEVKVDVARTAISGLQGAEKGKETEGSPRKEAAKAKK
jgi:preprotein translocase subunit YajC